MRLTCDGKQFVAGENRFLFRGVTYGTFAPREDGYRFPDSCQVKLDFTAMREAGFNVVRTYTAAPDDILGAAADWDLKVWPAAFWLDWRYLVGASRRQQTRMLRDARREVAEVTRRYEGDERVAALSLGNEIPADVIRWVGTDRVADAITGLADVVRSVDPNLLVTYANYPTTEYLPLDSLDFLTFNVFLERQSDFRRYLTRLHHLAGDRPLVLGEVGLDAGTSEAGEDLQAEVLDWQLRIATERGVAGTAVFSWTDEWQVGDQSVEGWHFGLTTAERTPRPALKVAAQWNERTVRDLDMDWPSMSVVICAYNAAATLDECLEHTCRLDYPDLEIIVVDDGSTDDTAAIARRYPRVRLVEIEHAGLSVARNAGFRAATSDLIAYLDSDAYPTPEWPWYLALAFDAPMVGGAGGPNVPPADDGLGAQQVARAPGGPVHVLESDDRAEHIPGCNMAFWKEVLEEVGGCDPIYQAAGDDVDLCWKVLDRGWEIGFHPAALVWHHRRSGLRPYLRQQRGYGRAEALVEARHPDRFTPLGSARWKGRIYNSLLGGGVGRQRVYRGLYGSAAYQSVYRGGGHALDIAHQAGLPAAVAALPAAAAIAMVSPLGGLALAALVVAFIATLATLDVARATPPRGLARGQLRFRFGVAVHHLLQPLVRTWGRLRSTAEARRDLEPQVALDGPIQRIRRTLILPAQGPRADLVAGVVADLRRSGLRVLPATGWEDHDARILASSVIAGELVTSAYPEGCVQLRIRRRFRRWAAVVAVAAVGLSLYEPALAAAFGVALAAEGARGWWRTGPGLRRVLREATT